MATESAAETGLSISLKAHTIFEIGGFPITSTLLMTWVVMITLTIMAVLVGMSIKKIPSKIQTFFEMMFGGILDYMEGVLESRPLARKFFPLITTLFFFILFGTWMGLLPGFSILDIKTAATHGEWQHFFHPINTDLNTTLALAFISFFVIQITGITMLGVWKYASKFINFSSPINFIVGIFELISEVGKLIAFSFRLFGNIFAGKTLILVATYFFAVLLPVPFLLFEVGVGLIQAGIFALLTLFFIKIAITEPH